MDFHITEDGFIEGMIDKQIKCMLFQKINGDCEVIHSGKVVFTGKLYDCLTFCIKELNNES